MGYFNVLFPFVSLAFFKSQFYNEKERKEEEKGKEGTETGSEGRREELELRLLFCPVSWLCGGPGLVRVQAL